MTCIIAHMIFSHTYEHQLQNREIVCQIENGNISPFNELIVSWNGFRPETGKWTFWVSLFQDEWSPWLKYAEWSASSQKTFHSHSEGSFAETYQDTAHSKKGDCTGYRIRLDAENGADHSSLKTLYACTSDLQKQAIRPPTENLSFVLLAAPKQSQMILDHPRHKDLCSPTSTSTALNYLLKQQAVQPLDFASKIHDDEWDIYGNWILNTAQAYQETAGQFRCHVERLNQFSDLHRYLVQDLPVVVSVRGPLPGAPHPYRSGHLICIIGYEPEQKRVYCIDSAFPDNTSTLTSYPLNDFLTAWSKRGNIAYVFPKTYKV